MLSAINSANTTPAFGSNLKLTKEFKNQLVTYVEKDCKGWEGVLPNYVKDGKFNSTKFFNHLRADFKEETEKEPGTVVFDKAAKHRVTGALMAWAKTFDDNGNEITRDRFRFNPTHLLSQFSRFSNHPNISRFFTEQHDFWSYGKSQKKIGDFYKYEQRNFIG